jgi:hypothetical protein
VTLDVESPQARCISNPVIQAGTQVSSLRRERERDSLIYTAQAGERRAKAQSTTMYIVKGE